MTSLGPFTSPKVMRPLEDLAPMRHRLAGKRFIQDPPAGCVGRRLGRIAEAWIGQQIGRPIAFASAASLSA
jgi:hypothetical protein